MTIRLNSVYDIIVAKEETYAKDEGSLSYDSDCNL